MRPSISVTSFLFKCTTTPLLGLAFAALGFYIIYGSNVIVISHSIEHATIISQAFTAIFSVWHFVALIPALSVVDEVRSEEWWRRLTHSTSFGRANSVSSNISGSLAHTVEIITAWSSCHYKVAWLAAAIAVILADVAPGAIHAQIGMNAIDAAFEVPALPPNSVYANYSIPFTFTRDQDHASIDIAPVYYKAMTNDVGYVKVAPPTSNAIMPRPNIEPGQGYRYSTDV